MKPWFAASVTALALACAAEAQAQPPQPVWANQSPPQANVRPQQPASAPLNSPGMENYVCRTEEDGTIFCHPPGGGRGYRQSGAIFVQNGANLNSDRLIDGSPRATLPPHNARGPRDRPSTTTSNLAGGWFSFLNF